MKKKIMWLFKALVACVVAFCIMSGFCHFYYNLPIHFTNTTKATDYYWEKNSYSSRGTEGFVKVSTDENGHVNTYEPKCEKIDALVMGSSHTEAFNVGEKENFTYLLNDKFSKEENNLYFYNIGTSGHSFDRCLRNLEDAIKEFKPSEYVIIETNKVNFSVEELKILQEGKLEYLPSYESGFIYHLQKSNLLRLLFAQFSNVLENEKLPTFKSKTTAENSAINTKPSQDVLDEYERRLDEILKSSSEIAEKNGCKLIFVYIPYIEIDYNGNIIERKISRQYEFLKRICEKYGIGFVDTYDGFSDYYFQNKTLLQGFSNTGIGVGHINKHGHAVIADELYSYILEESKK